MSSIFNNYFNYHICSIKIVRFLCAVEYILYNFYKNNYYHVLTELLFSCKIDKIGNKRTLWSVITETLKNMRYIHTYFLIIISNRMKLVASTPLNKCTNSRITVAKHVSRFASNDACREKERRRKRTDSLLLFSYPSPASSSFQHESVPWKMSKIVLRIATDLSQPSLHRASMLFFMLLLHPPSRDATIQCAPNKSAKPPECHGWWQPRVMSRPSALWLI